MAQLIQTTSFIRQRGQLTIPEKIRSERTWASKGSVVTISTEKPDEIKIQPYSSTKEVDWDRVWESIKKARSIPGKNKISLSEFIAKDRQTHF